MSEMKENDNDLEAKRRRFLELVETVRPSLHRYCGRMVGSALDGEDVVQETLAQAYDRLETFDPHRPIEPWLFRIAHNRAIDFLRRQRIVTVPLSDEHDAGVAPEDEIQRSEEVSRAVTMLLHALPPKERACVLLKDVLDYSLADIAGIVDSTVGGVKAALHRGREKLRGRNAVSPPARHHPDPSLLARYVRSFNARDWTAVRDLIGEDARLVVVGKGEAAGRDSIADGYLGNYSRFTFPWRFTVGHVDGEEVIIQWRQVNEAWRPHSAARLEVEAGQVVAIRDYIHADYLLEDALLDGTPPSA